MFTTSIHTHVRSLFDAHIEPNELTARIKDLGGKGICITDHGVLSSIEDYRPAFAEAGLKLIPGVELYVDGGVLGKLHLIVLAKNDNGYKGICKMVTESNRHLDGELPVLTKEQVFEIARQYKGDIICTSACMQGVVSAIFLQNDEVEKVIKEIESKRDKYISPSSNDYILAMDALEEAESNLQEAIRVRDNTKAIAEQKFTKREKAVAKAEDTGSEDAVALREALEADKAAAIKAQDELPVAKENVENCKKAVSQAKKKYKANEESVEKYLGYEEEIIALRKDIKSEAELYAVALATAKEYQAEFGENFYIEVQYHGIAQEAYCFPRAVKVARELGISLVASNNVHILTNSEDDRLRRQILRSLSSKKDFEEENIGDSELYLKSDEELSEALSEILPKDAVEESISNIATIFDSCNVEFKTGKHYPKFSDNSSEIFEDEIEKGIAWRFPEGMNNEHKERLAYEKNIISTMGYIDYHLIVKDFLEYGRLLGYVPKSKIDEAPLTKEALQSYIHENGWKNQGRYIGPGRGSAVGSLVCYVLGITDIDPMEYNLLFERFLNPDRVSMPDIDSDIANTIRPKVIEYVKNRYGQNAVCGIMTTNAQAPKGAVRIAAKYYGLKQTGMPLKQLGDTIAKDVSGEVGVHFNSMVDPVTGNLSKEDNAITLMNYLEGKYGDINGASEVLRWAQNIEGVFTAYGAHAAGIVISDNDDISEYLPLRMNTTLGMLTTQCDMVQTEDSGLLKFDFLGLQTLDIITETLRMVEKNTGIIIKPENINLEDERVYSEIFAAGNTKSVFQFESDGMRAMLKRFKPTCFEDLIILVSMFRPGPLQFLDDVIEVKNGRKPITYLCPELEPILGSTYGAMVYQEQVMSICQNLAGFTLARADNVRRYMSKKKADKLEHERESFVSGCGERGINSEIANKIFDQMTDFARYAFNKSHATAYALNAYHTAWLKLYQPAEFFASALNWTTSKKLSGLMNEAYKMGVVIDAPDINKSDKEFTTEVTEDGTKILFGLSAVMGVKDHADDIIAERENGEYLSVKDFCYRAKSNIGVCENLVDAGAFDSFANNRAAIKTLIGDVKDLVSGIVKKESFIKSAEHVLAIVETASAEDIINSQITAGLKAEITEPTTVDKLSKRIETAKKTLSGLMEEYTAVALKPCAEDKKARLSRERELLGRYVTGHPIDNYPSAGEVKAGTIANVLDGQLEVKTRIYGIATDIRISQRKSDGAEMAFFTLTDKESEVEVCVFTKAYSGYGNLVKEGEAIVITGKLMEKDSYGDSDDGEEERVYQFIAESIKAVEEKKSSFMIEVSSYATFHLDVEEAFREEYEDSEGHRLLIHDKAMDEIREALYRVNEKTRELPNFQELFI